MLNLVKKFFSFVSNSKINKDEKGAASVEFAILLSLILLVIGGISELSYQGVVKTNLDRMSNELSDAITSKDKVLEKKDMIKIVQSAKTLAQTIGYEKVEVFVSQYEYKNGTLIRTSGNNENDITTAKKTSLLSKQLIQEGQSIAIVSLTVSHEPFMISDILGDSVVLNGTSVAFSSLN